MAVAEAAVLQEVALGEEGVELGGDVRAAGAGPDAARGRARGRRRWPPRARGWRGVGVAEEERALERGVVAGDHREGVEREDVAGLERGGLVTGLWAPSVLRPDWNQTQVSRSSASGKARAISRLHRVAAGRSRRRSRGRRGGSRRGWRRRRGRRCGRPRGSARSRPATSPCAGASRRGRCRRRRRGRGRRRAWRGPAASRWSPSMPRRRPGPVSERDGAPEVVALPVGVGERLAVAAAARLAAVDVGGDESRCARAVTTRP